MPIVPGLIRVEQTFRSTGSATATNVLHFLSIGGDFDQATMDQLVQDWTGGITPIINANWVVEGVVRCLDLSTDPPGEIYSSTTNNNGTVSGGALPPGVAAVVSLTAGASRRRRGRMYLPGMTEAKWDDDGIAVGTVQADILAAVANAVGDVAVNADYVLAVYSRVDNVARAVQSIGVDGVLDSQRRRQARLA